MDIDKARQFAAQWLTYWNKHDIEAVVSSFAEDCEVTSPLIQIVLGIPTGTLKGRAILGGYWRNVLKKEPDLKLSLIGVASGVNGMSIYCNTGSGKKAIKTLNFNDKNQISRMYEAYD